MIDFMENEVVGTAMNTIRARFGHDKTDKLADALLSVDKLTDLDGEYMDMVRYGIENTDYTTGRPKKKENQHESK